MLACRADRAVCTWLQGVKFPGSLQAACTCLPEVLAELAAAAQPESCWSCSLAGSSALGPITLSCSLWSPEADWEAVAWSVCNCEPDSEAEVCSVLFAVSKAVSAVKARPVHSSEAASGVDPLSAACSLSSPEADPAAEAQAAS